MIVVLFYGVSTLFESFNQINEIYTYVLNSNNTANKKKQ